MQLNHETPEYRMEKLPANGANDREWDRRILKLGTWIYWPTKHTKWPEMRTRKTPDESGSGGSPLHPRKRRWLSSRSSCPAYVRRGSGRRAARDTGSSAAFSPRGGQ